ncbi:MAG TPA: hypothetical protein VF678_09535, partial [bacterium]
MDTPTHSTPSSAPLTPNQHRTLKAGYMRIKHGLHSTRAVIPGESLEEFQSFRHDMVLYLMPGNPLEDALAEQLVMIQWKLRRLWASQTGVYRNHAERNPTPDEQPARETSPAVDTFPQRAAQCVHDDNARQGDLHRLNMEEQRLINLFTKVMKQYEQHGQQRSKRLQAGAKWNYVETEEYYPAPDGTLAHRIVPPVYDMDPLSHRPAPEPPDAEAPAPTPELPEPAPAVPVAEAAAQ